MQNFPRPPPSFAEKKQRILEQLAVPDSEYQDASPKGSVDAGIRELIDEINAADGFVTTSSCAGRVCVFKEGRKDRQSLVEPAGRGQVAGPGGKGGGGTWLYVSHEPIADRDESRKVWAPFLAEVDESEKDIPRQLIHFKFEPMILHVLTASPEHAQLLLRCGLQAGFRESGAINLVGSAQEPATPMVAIRTNGLAFESLVGFQEIGERVGLCSRDFHGYVIGIANQRFEENSKRIERFRDAFAQAVTQPPPVEWEDAGARRERKRAEGLKRRQQLQTKEAAFQGHAVDERDSLEDMHFQDVCD